MENATMLTLFSPPEKKFQADKFFEYYNISKAIFPSEPNDKELKKKSDRICMFCGKGVKEGAKFNKVAHVIPELMGNKYLKTDSECDSCNQSFGRYENDLANFLGITRTIQKIKAKEKIPTFKNNFIKAKATNFFGKEAIIVHREKTTNDVFLNNLTNGELTISAHKNKYRPLFVYKALMKVSLSLIDKNLLNDYKDAIKFVLDPQCRVNGCFISGYSLPLGINFPPHAYIFKKRSALLPVHTHVMALYSGNLIIALPIILNLKDYFFYGKENKFYTYPPLFLNSKLASETMINPFMRDMSDPVAFEEKDQFVIQIDQEEFKKAAKLNLTTNEIESSQFNPSEITQLIFSDIKINDRTKD